MTYIFQKFTFFGTLFKDDIWSILAAATATTTSKVRLCEVKSYNLPPCGEMIYINFIFSSNTFLIYLFRSPSNNKFR
jgi:hypothetical protein